MNNCDHVGKVRFAGMLQCQDAMGPVFLMAQFVCECQRSFFFKLALMDALPSGFTMDKHFWTISPVAESIGVVESLVPAIKELQKTDPPFYGRAENLPELNPLLLSKKEGIEIEDWVRKVRKYLIFNGLCWQNDKDYRVVVSAVFCKKLLIWTLERSEYLGDDARADDGVLKFRGFPVIAEE